MSVFNPNKVIDKSELNKNDSTNLTISFDASAELVSTPSDILILFDRSESMIGDNITFAKNGLKQLISNVVEASRGIKDVHIGNNSRIGLVSFAFDAVVETELTDDVKLINSKIDNMKEPWGKTNHEEGFKVLRTLVDKTSKNKVIVVAFTDGETSYGQNPVTIINQLKNEDGAEVYCLGLTKKPYIFRPWASSPFETHIVTTKEPTKIEEIFKKISHEIIRAGAIDVVVNEVLNTGFIIENIIKVSNGTIELLDNKSFNWNIDATGLKELDREECVVKIKYVGEDNGEIDVNSSITYKDRNGNSLIFPNPKVIVKNSKPIVIPSEIILCDEFSINGCLDSKIIKTSETYINNGGHLIKVDVLVNNVLPNRNIKLLIDLILVKKDKSEVMVGSKNMFLSKIIDTKENNLLLKNVMFIIPNNSSVDYNNDNFKTNTTINYI